MITRIVFVAIFYLMATSSCCALGKFTLRSHIGFVSVEINGKSYDIDSIGIKILTNYPKFDSLKFLSEGSNSDDLIICNFKSDSIYVVSFSCCQSVDIFQSYKLKNDSLRFWDLETDLEKIQNQLMDKPFISIGTKNKPKDSIYAWHSDISCVTEHKLITTKPWRLGIPPKCFYWTNITRFQFFKTDHKLPKHKPTFMEEFLEINNIVELADVALRLFDNDRFIICFDEKNNTISPTYEEG